MKAIPFVSTATHVLTTNGGQLCGITLSATAACRVNLWDSNATAVLSRFLGTIEASGAGTFYHPPIDNGLVFNRGIVAEVVTGGANIRIANTAAYVS